MSLFSPESLFQDAVSRYIQRRGVYGLDSPIVRNCIDAVDALIEKFAAREEARGRLERVLPAFDHLFQELWGSRAFPCPASPVEALTQTDFVEGPEEVHCALHNLLVAAFGSTSASIANDRRSVWVRVSCHSFRVRFTESGFEISDA